ncbi:uncharacterized protein RHOBADRAFT_50510, partial [Rhodotorula graminis WP1]
RRPRPRPRSSALVALGRPRTGASTLVPRRVLAQEAAPVRLPQRRHRTRRVAPAGRPPRIVGGSRPHSGHRDPPHPPLDPRRPEPAHPLALA